LDHVLPVAKGGPNESWNYLPICKEANIRKGDTYPYYDSNGIDLSQKVKKVNNFIYVEDFEYREEWESFVSVKTYGKN
jgi:hypothetical protein